MNSRCWKACPRARRFPNNRGSGSSARQSGTREEAGGRATARHEKDTRIEVSGGLEVIGKWRQSPPKDLSQREINWFTWGFEGVTLFAAKVKKTGGAECLITIYAQACKATTCAMVDDLEIRLPLYSSENNRSGFDLSRLVEEGDLSGLN